MKAMHIIAAAIAVASIPATAGTYVTLGDTSAYVRDWAIGAQYTNFAFLSANNSFVGSWQVDAGPSWTTLPTAYSGLTAAALLFGGSASDYFISTVNNNSANINHLTWVSTWGGACNGTSPCGTEVAENFVKSTGGTVPEPASWAMLVAGFGLVGATMRRRAGARVAA